MVATEARNAKHEHHEEVEVVLIGGGIMSATLGSMLAFLEPDWRIVLLERGDSLAPESSDPWRNAGTGHSGYCELNYMPDPGDGARAASIARQFLLTREWWAHLAGEGLLDPAAFIHATAHLDVVFGARDRDYLRQRYTTLQDDPFFRGMEFTDDPAAIARWAPLVGEGRVNGEPAAATRMDHGTDVDFGALTKALVRVIERAGGESRLGHEVRSIERARDGAWLVRGRHGQQRFAVRGRFVFVGAGGYALRLLQKARLPEVRGYAVLPVGAAFLRCANPAVVARHAAKVYGQAPVGAPPMSVPHLDRRVVEGREFLMFGPYATFSTKLLVHGRLTDFFRTLHWANLPVITAAMAQNLPLVRYLIGQLAAGQRTRFRQLQRFYPDADPRDWELVPAGQRAQLVTPDPRRIGALRHGTELVVGAGGGIAGLLGASPGASTAVPIMLDLLQRCFPELWRARWRHRVDEAIPGRTAEWTAGRVEESLRRTARALDL
ncbi:malate dehydrogenase (quinone) [Sediminivirga luteola]|uniref:Probable malate:quinone oxidoreductase n=1 Tax=Sediminivirga luteola TaxID=1774748 RepID=A0A8J2TXA3_9MICO|nr:malate dehydrogenase (quinone) [Sediminivirga luteola]GGA11745.1 putative malate:quinone oxidoreductase [Sediminivirga luteola]